MTEAQLKVLGCSFDEALIVGAANAASGLEPLEVTDGLVRWERRGAEVVVLLGNEVGRQLPIRGAAVVMVPREGLVLMAGDDDPQALARMVAQAATAYEDSDDKVSLRALRWGTEPTPSGWLPPEGHALRTQFRLAVALTRIHDARRRHLVSDTKDTPLAHLAALDQHGGVLRRLDARRRRGHPPG